MIQHWSIARRAAAVIVAPVFDYNMATVAAAISAGAGGLLLLGGASPPASLGSQLASTVSGERPPFPPLVMADQEGGGVQRLTPPVTSTPWPRVMAETMTAGQIEQLATTVGRQMRILGVNVDLAPVLDVDGGDGPNVNDPDGLRSFSPVPSVAARDSTDSLSAGAIAQAGYPVPQAAATAIAAGAELFGSTLTPAQTATLAPDGVRATISEMVAAIVRATQTGALSPARLTDAVEQAITAVHADLCENST